MLLRLRGAGLRPLRRRRLQRRPGLLLCGGAPRSLLQRLLPVHAAPRLRGALRLSRSLRRRRGFQRGGRSGVRPLRLLPRAEARPRLRRVLLQALTHALRRPATTHASSRGPRRRQR